ncbi:hypothetical protein [Allonocardiopsis opalescens]|uniref:Uncharacterized protein n=1 Tax=Allonocardiopsis opalescens TaxID=1144618 RepID=A0A2T0PVN5_9ACTN|nr:hypothetical protein [Allonocardiopsis opalescens]PRX95593.1 hypothetical protein CLV72_109202 [Allonocardiopsis opalescens]
MMRLIIPTPYWGCGCGHRIDLDHDDRWPDITEAVAEHEATHAGPPVRRVLGAPAEDVRRAIAHDLADRIRAAAAAGDLNAPEYGSHENVLEAADLIDPEEH